MADATGYKFPILSSDGTTTTTVSTPVFAANNNGPGYLWACGYSYLGTGTVPTSTKYSSPVQIGALTTWKSVSGARYSGAAVGNDGTLWTWGTNDYGQLGRGNTINYSSPVQVGLLTNWSQVSCGYVTNYAIKTDGTLWTWGYNLQGQMGNGTITPYSSPVQIGALTNWSQVSSGGGYHVAAIKTDGTLWAWGRYNHGQLGNGVSNVSAGVGYSSPVQIGALTNWSQVSCGYAYTMAVKTNGTLWGCGYNRYGQLGDGSRTYFSSPIQIGALTNWKQVSSSYSTTAAVKTDGTLWAWGWDGYKQFGDNGTFTGLAASSPIQMGALTTWNQVSMGLHNAAAIKTDGTLWTWGENGYGELGNGTVTSYSSPIQVGLVTNWNSVFASYYKMFAISNPATYTTSTVNNPIVDMADVFVNKNQWYNSGLWSWGRGIYGKLGNNANNDYSSPIQVGSLTNWKQVSAGAFHAMALKTDGTLWTWGYNNLGQLGTVSGSYYSSPIQIGPLTNWKQISAGAQTTAATKTDGTLWAWGYNNYGQLGNGTNGINYFSPIQIGALTNWKQVSCGYNTAAVKTDGTLWTWGRNNLGQLGYEVPVFGVNAVYSPVQVAGGSTWSNTAFDTQPLVISSAGQHAGSIRTDGTLWMWGGSNFGHGVLGNGTTIAYSSPIQIGSLTNWKQISFNYFHTMAIKTDGTLWGWGNNNSGMLGNGTQPYSSPVQIGSLTNWKQVATGYTSSVAVKTDGTLWTWGNNTYGTLGITPQVTYSSPIQVGLLTNWSQVTSAMYAVGAIKTDGTLWTWGDGRMGNLGNGGIGYVYSPIQIGTLTNWKQIAMGYYTSMAVKTDGTLWGWGNNQNGQLGNGTTAYYSSPIQIGSATNWKQVACGGQGFTAAIKTDGTLWTWGYGLGGALGQGSTTQFNTPTQLGLLTNWSHVYCTLDSIYATNNNNYLYASGPNNFGSLGAPSTLIGDSSSPIQVGSLTNWKQVSTVYFITVAIKNDGTLWAWGGNAVGGLGNGTASVYYSSPIQIGSLTNWKQVSTSGSHTMAIKTDGTLWGWGYNGAHGSLGVNSASTDYSSPVQVGSLTNWKQVSANYVTTSAVKTDGTLWTWGYNYSGSLGNGTTIHYSSPVQIGALTNWSQVATGESSMAAIQAPDLELAQYVPGIPTGVTVTTINSTAVSVSFTAPTYNGNSPITSYEVSY